MNMLPERYYRYLINGLFLFSFSLPLSKSVSTVALLLVVLGTVFCVIKYPDFRTTIFKHLRQPVLLPAFLIVLTAVAGLVFTENLSTGLTLIHKLSDLLLIYVTVAVLLQSAENEDEDYRISEKLLISFILGMAVLDAIGIMTFLGIIGTKQYTLPLAPIKVHHIWFANMNAMAMYIAGALMFYSPQGMVRRTRLLLGSFILLGIVCIVLSTSRTAWLGMVVTSTALAFILIKRKRVLFATLASLIGVSMLLYVFNPIIHERVSLAINEVRQFSSESVGTSIGDRFLMWKAAFSMFLSNPLVGAGTGDYMRMLRSYVAAGDYPSHLLEYNQPHSMYLYALATNGLLGFAALVFYFIRILRVANGLFVTRLRLSLFGITALAVTIHFMIAGLTDSLLSIQILRYSFIFIIAVCVRHHQTRPAGPLHIDTSKREML